MKYAVDISNCTYVIVAHYRGICKDGSLTCTQAVNFAFEGNPHETTLANVKREVQAFFNKKYGCGKDLVTSVKIVQINRLYG